MVRELFILVSRNSTCFGDTSTYLLSFQSKQQSFIREDGPWLISLQDLFCACCSYCLWEGQPQRPAGLVHHSLGQLTNDARHLLYWRGVARSLSSLSSSTTCFGYSGWPKKWFYIYTYNHSEPPKGCHLFACLKYSDSYYLIVRYIFILGYIVFEFEINRTHSMCHGLFEA